MLFLILLDTFQYICLTECSRNQLFFCEYVLLLMMVIIKLLRSSVARALCDKKCAFVNLPTGKSEQHGYDCYQRNPLYCQAQNECLWELQSLTHHYHPSVSLYACTILQVSILVIVVMLAGGGGFKMEGEERVFFEYYPSQISILVCAPQWGTAD